LDSNIDPSFCLFAFNHFYQHSIAEKQYVFQANKFFIEKNTRIEVSLTVRKMIPNIDV